MSKRGWPHVDDPDSVGRRLKEARLEAGMSQRELAFPGCTAVYICRIEKGDRVPSLQVLRELARRLGVEEDWLATGASSPAQGEPLLEAEVALRLGQAELAEHLYEQVLDGFTRPDDRARALAGLGQIDFHAGRIEDAITRLEEARQLSRDPGIVEPALSGTLGRAYAMKGEYEAAIGVLEHALERARERADEQAEARLAVPLANTLIDSGNLPAARQLLGALLARATGDPDPLVQARLFWSQSRLHSAERNHDAAARYARMALASIELTENVAYAARAHHLLAFVELERGNAEAALELLDRGYPLVQRTDDAHMRAIFRLERARCLAALGRGEEAASAALEVAGTLTEMSPPEAGRAYCVAAEVFAQRGESGHALELYELAAELFSDDAPTYLVDVYRRMAELLEEMGRKDEALEVLKRAVGLQPSVRDTA